MSRESKFAPSTSAWQFKKDSKTLHLMASPEIRALVAQEKGQMFLKYKSRLQ